MTDNVEQCAVKFKKLLEVLNSEGSFSDDTFLEKIITYLKLPGEWCDFSDFIAARRHPNEISQYYLTLSLHLGRIQ